MTDLEISDAELANRRRLRNTMLLLLVVAATIVGLAYMFWPQGEPSPVLAVDEVVEVTFDFQATSAGQTGMTGGASRPQYYAELIEVLSSGRESANHKCPDTGRIVIKLRDGTELHYGTLSGHDERFYEFRVYDDRNFTLYRVQREPMASALEKLGIERVDEPRPE